MTFRNKAVLWLLLLGLAFAVGFGVEYREVQAIRQDLEAMRQQLEQAKVRIQSNGFQLQLARLRDLAGLMYMETARHNYELASRYSTDFFNALRRAADDATDPALKSSLEELSANRDAVTSLLAKGTPAATSNVQSLFIQLHSMTQTESQ